MDTRFSFFAFLSFVAFSDCKFLRITDGYCDSSADETVDMVKGTSAWPPETTQDSSIGLQRNGATYMSWVENAWSACVAVNPAVRYLSVFADAGFRCWTNCPSITHDTNANVRLWEPAKDFTTGIYPWFETLNGAVTAPVPVANAGGQWVANAWKLPTVPGSSWLGSNAAEFSSGTWNYFHLIGVLNTDCLRIDATGWADDHLKLSVALKDTTSPTQWILGDANTFVSNYATPVSKLEWGREDNEKVPDLTVGGVPGLREFNLVVTVTNAAQGPMGVYLTGSVYTAGDDCLPVPSAAPSAAPSVAPSAAPSVAPSVVPSASTFSPTFSPTVAPTVTAGGKDDPHMKGFHNEFFDIRGVNHNWINMLSHTFISVAALFSDTTYVTDANQTVHGSFMTQVAVVLRATPIKRLHVLSSPPNAADVSTYVVQTGAPAVLMQSKRLLAAGAVVKEGNVTIATEEMGIDDGFKLSITLKDQWRVSISPRAYYAKGNATKQYSVDLTMNPLSPSVEHGPVAPHGLIGQTLDGDAMAIDGNHDNYSAPVVSTSAQGEGAIEGTIDDYVLSHPFSTEFKFKRWSSFRAKARDTAKLTGGRHSQAKRGADMSAAAGSGKVWW